MVAQRVADGWPSVPLEHLGQSWVGRNVSAQAAFIGLASALTLLGVSARIGVRDSDAFAYVVAAYSLQHATGYRTLTGEPLNHWPPGYSWLLSLFADPLAAALLINACAFGAAVALTYALSRRAGWSTSTAASLAAVLGAGFFRHLATNAEPDIVVYATFLAAAYLLWVGRPGMRIGALALLSALVPLKLIAIPFTPAAVLTTVVTKRIGTRWELGLAVTTWLLGVASVCVFNDLTIGAIIPDSHPPATFASFAENLALFPRSVLRDLVSFWAGSIFSMRGLVFFGTLLLAGVSALATLRVRRSQRWLLLWGSSVLVLSLGMELARDFSADARLLAYGLLVLLCGVRPALATARTRWLTYAALAVVTAVVEGQSTDPYGLNDPRYASTARDVVAAGLPPGPLYTNAPRVLDLHERIPTIGVADASAIAEPRTSDVYLQFDEPGAAPEPAGWCRAWRIPGAALFRRC